jgi:hypothetical protein
MDDPEDFADQLERDEREADLEQQRENNDDGRTDAEMYDEYGPSDDDDFHGDDY